MSAIKVLLVDDEELIRSALSILLSTFSDIEIVGSVGNGQEASDYCQNHPVDLVLMDIRMPVVNGIEGTRLIKGHHPEIKILILTTFQDREYIQEAMRVGASGYLLNDSSHEAIYDGIKVAMSGKVVLDQQVSATFLADQVSSTKVANELTQEKAIADYQLTPKEVQIIQLVAKGLSNKEISQALFLSEGTIKNNMSYILGKINLRDRTQLAIFAYENHFV